MAPKPFAETKKLSWLHNAVGYEVYIRSFADSTGNGVGDLAGITQRLDYLAWLGIDIVWITPCYPSPMADHGYDVADYVDIEPIFGDLAVMQELIDRAHELDLRVVLDIVPNHSSNQHRWFRAAVEDPTGPYRDYYLWRDPAPDGGPPNNWVAHFGGPAWTLDDASGQYYCHLFLPEQPDLNWRNPALRAEFEQTLEFWFERGIDGFRIDVAHALIKDREFRDNPQVADLANLTHPREQFRCFEHRYDLQQPESLEIYRDWRRIAERYDTALIGETYVLDPAGLADLVPGDGLHLGFWFAPMQMPWTAPDITKTLRETSERLGDRVGWVQSSHDESRPATRFGGGDLGRRRSLAFAAMLMGLPGVPFIYQGEELGLEDGDVPPELRSDPIATRNVGAVGRDVCRTPMPWEPGHNLGFSSADQTWLPLGHGVEDSVAVQRQNPDAHVHKMRSLLQFRRQLSDLDPIVTWLDTSEGVVAFQRGDHLFALNTNDEATDFTPGGVWSLVHRTGTGQPAHSVQTIHIDGAETVVFAKPSSGPVVEKHR